MTIGGPDGMRCLLFGLGLFAAVCTISGVEGRQIEYARPPLRRQDIPSWLTFLFGRRERDVERRSGNAWRGQARLGSEFLGKRAAPPTMAEMRQVMMTPDSFMKRVPGSEFLGKRVPGSEFLGKRVPGSEFLGKRVPGSEFLGKRVPGSEFLGKRVPGSEFLGKRVPGSEFLGKRRWAPGYLSADDAYAAAADEAEIANLKRAPEFAIEVGHGDRDLNVQEGD